MRISRLVVLMMMVSSVALFGEAPTPQTTDTASIILAGNVAKKVTIDVTGIGDYGNLNLMDRVNDLAVATVNEFSNVKAGYTVSLQSSSANASGLTNPVFVGGEGDDTLEYTITYDGTAVAFNGGAAATITDASDKTALAGIDKSLNISYDGTVVNIYEGTYSDTLTFTITAK